jgi:Tfp pilus assembly protein PilF
LEEALTVCRDKGQQAYLLGCLGVSLRKQGALPEARERHREALALYESVGRTQTAAIEKMRLGVVYCQQDDYARAQQFFQEATTEGDILTRAGALAEWARLELLRGERGQAEVFFAEALALQRGLGNQPEVDALRSELARAGIQAPAAEP